jgi:hypothetical protein
VAAHLASIDLGTAVRLSLARAPYVGEMAEDGVVIEVVEPWAYIESRWVDYPPPRLPKRRYVVQCQTCRVVRLPAGLVVVAQ